LLAGEKSGHGRIDVLVRAGDGKAFFLHGRGGGRHGGATNANKMDRFDFRRKHQGRINRQEAKAQSFWESIQAQSHAGFVCRNLPRTGCPQIM